MNPLKFENEIKVSVSQGRLELRELENLNPSALVKNESQLNRRIELLGDMIAEALMNEAKKRVALRRNTDSFFPNPEAA